MRRSVLRPLSAPLCALLLASATAVQAQEPAAQPVSAAASSPAPASSPAHKAIPQPQQVQPIDAPTPSLEQIARAFDPTPGGLTADEIVAKALLHSPELKKAELSEDTAKANKARASIAFAPRFDFQGKYTHVSKLSFTNALASTDIVETGDPIQDAVSRGLQNAFGRFSFQQLPNQYYSSAGVTLPVTEMFLTVIPTYHGAATLAEVAAKRVEASALQVSYDARMAFYGYAHVIGAVIVAERAVALYEANVHDLDALVQAGTATQTDLIRARSELARMKVNVIEFTGQLDVALARLAVITGTQLDGKRGIGEAFVGIEMGPTPETARLTSEAKRSRPEVIALRKLEDARKYLANGRRGAQYPQLKGFFNGYYANPHPRVAPQQDRWYGSWDVGVSLSYSPNDSIYAHTQYKDALTDLASVREDLRLVEDGIAMEAANAVSTHRTAVANTQAASESLEAARRYQMDQRELMLAGAATPNDVLEAQLLLTRSALSWVDSFISFRMAEAAVLKAQGKTSSSTSAVRSTP